MIVPGSARDKAESGQTREYWIQAESYQANPVPTEYDEMMGMKVTRPTFTGLRYRAYAPHWETLLPIDEASFGLNASVPGPTIRANVGDTIIVHFKNADEHYQQPHSIRAFGVKFDSANDGTWTAQTQSAANFVKYGETFTYRWKAVPSSVGFWNYQDSFQSIQDFHY